MKSAVFTASFFFIAILAGCRSADEVDADPTGQVTTTPGSSTSASSGMLTSDTTGLALRSMGTFMSNVHPTSGTVSVYEKEGKRTLVFTNFKTDGGPDLRIYLAENTGLRNFIELARLPGTGTFSVDLPAEADPARQRYVLIWCKAFSVLFGNAELK